MSKNGQTLQDMLRIQEILDQRAYEIGWDTELQSVHDAVTTSITSLKERET